MRRAVKYRRRFVFRAIIKYDNERERARGDVEELGEGEDQIRLYVERGERPFFENKMSVINKTCVTSGFGRRYKWR